MKKNVQTTEGNWKNTFRCGTLVKGPLPSSGKSTGGTGAGVFMQPGID